MVHVLDGLLKQLLDSTRAVINRWRQRAMTRAMYAWEGVVERIFYNDESPDATRYVLLQWQRQALKRAVSVWEDFVWRRLKMVEGMRYLIHRWRQRALMLAMFTWEEFIESRLEMLDTLQPHVLRRRQASLTLAMHTGEELVDFEEGRAERAGRAAAVRSSSIEHWRVTAIIKAMLSWEPWNRLTTFPRISRRCPRDRAERVPAGRPKWATPTSARETKGRGSYLLQRRLLHQNPWQQTILSLPRVRRPERR